MAREETIQRQITLKAILGSGPGFPRHRNSDLVPTIISDRIDPQYLVELAGKNPTQVKMAEANASKSEVSLKLAQQDYIPDFDAGYSYQKTGPGLRDYYMLSFGAKIPLYFWRKQTPAVEQAALERSPRRERTAGEQARCCQRNRSRMVCAQDWRSRDRVLSRRAAAAVARRVRVRDGVVSFRPGRLSNPPFGVDRSI